MFYCVYSQAKHTANITMVRHSTELAVQASKIFFKSSTTCVEMLTLFTISCNQIKSKQIDFKRTVRRVFASQRAEEKSAVLI